MSGLSRHVALAVVVALLGMGAPAAAQAPGAKWPSSSAPRPLVARDVRFPPYELRTLPNGLKVVVVVHPEQPVVSVRLITGAGGAQDPPGKPGVAALVSSLLDQGTTTRTAQQVADAIDSAGGRLTTGLGRDLSFAHVLVMKDGLAFGMNLLADVVRNPAFAAEELDRQRRQTLSALQVSYQDPNYLANLVFDRLVYGANPYGEPGNGTPESLPQITRDDLVAFHRAHFAPNNTLMAVVGDVTVAEAVDAVTKAFGDWEKREVPPFNPTEPPQPARRVIVVDKPDAVQTEIRVGHLGIPRKSTDYMAVDLAVRILGGAGANRLHRVLRVERGLTYGASAETETLKRGGQVVAETNTRSDATGEVLRLIVDEYWRLRRERVGEGELSSAKAYMTGNFPLTIETADDIATQVLNALFYDLPLEELQTFRQRVNLVSVDDIENAASKYLRPDRLAVVLVGRASEFVEQLKGVGFGKYEVIALSQLDVNQPDLRRKTPAPMQADRAGGTRWPAGLAHPLHALASGAGAGNGPASQAAVAVPEAADSLIKRAIGAKGGFERLKSIKTIEATATTTLMLPQGPVTSRTSTFIEYPDRFRVEAQLPNGVVVQVYGGEQNVWVQDPQKGVMTVPAHVRRDFKASVDRDIIPLLLRAAAGELTVRLLQPSGTDGTRAVEVSGGGIDPVTLHIDVASGLVMRQSYRLHGAAGTAEEVFADYREVEGLKVAFKASVRRNNLPVLERTVTEFRVNPRLRPGLFDRPAAQDNR